MTRTVITFGMILLSAACSGSDGDRPVVPPASVLVDDAGGAPFDPALSPDGTRLAWVKTVEGRAAIFVGNPDGTEGVRLTHGVWDYMPIWSQDGQWIAYHAEGPDFDIFVVPSTGGEPRQLTSGPGYDSPLYALPDGGIVFTRERMGPVQTLVVPLGGGPERPLIPAGSGNRLVVLSPDGTKALIGVDSANTRTIRVRDMATGATKQLTDEGMELITIHAWSPDGRSIVYQSRRTGTADIWVADVESGQLRQITTDVHGDEEARWSPDGRWILFRSNRGGQADLWIASVDGGQPRRVTNDLAFELDHSWGSDGTIYILSSQSRPELQSIPIDGGPARTLVSWPGYDINQVTASPDGSTILFRSNRSGVSDIWAIPSSGGEPAPFANSAVEDSEPLFSPDGAQVVFHTHRAGGSADLWLMPAAGGEGRPLTDWPSEETLARWSPDGTMIAFTSNRDSDRMELWVIPVGGGEARRLTRNNGDIGTHRWSPDGRTIYFIGTTATGTADLFRVAVDGGEPEPLGANPLIGVGDLSPDGTQFAYAAFSGGWAYVEVIPTVGGTPRRLSPQTEGIYHFTTAWSPDGTAILVGDYVLAADANDLLMVSWPDGEWRNLTRTPVIENAHGFLDNGHVLTVAFDNVEQIVAVRVDDLLRDPGS